jgi:hypothetical protein
VQHVSQYFSLKDNGSGIAPRDVRLETEYPGYTGKGGSKRKSVKQVDCRTGLFAIECDLSATETLDRGGTVLGVIPRQRGSVR